MKAAPVTLPTLFLLSLLWSPKRAALKARCRAGDRKAGANDKSSHEGLSSTDRPGAGPAPFCWDSPLRGGLEQRRAQNLQVPTIWSHKAQGTRNQELWARALSPSNGVTVSKSLPISKLQRHSTQRLPSSSSPATPSLCSAPKRGRGSDPKVSGLGWSWGLEVRTGLWCLEAPGGKGGVFEGHRNSTFREGSLGGRQPPLPSERHCF